MDLEKGYVVVLTSDYDIEIPGFSVKPKFLCGIEDCGEEDIQLLFSYDMEEAKSFDCIEKAKEFVSELLGIFDFNFAIVSKRKITEDFK